MFTTFRFRRWFKRTRPTLQIATRPFRSPDPRFTLTDRQELVPGFSQEALRNAHVLLVGAGGIGGEIGEGLVRKGIGKLTAIDPDVVDATNLARQWFLPKDLYKPKAFALIRNLAPHALCGTTLTAHAMSFQDAVALRLDLSASVVVCGVDNGEARRAVYDHYQGRRIPVLFIAVDRVAEAGHVFVQEPGKTCFGCAFPESLEAAPAPCRTPACKDILKVVGGISLYAIDTLLMERKRSWNYRKVHLAGFAPSAVRMIERNPACPFGHA